MLPLSCLQGAQASARGLLPGDRTRRVQLPVTAPRIVLLPDFLSNRECNHLKWLVRDRVYFHSVSYPIRLVSSCRLIFTTWRTESMLRDVAVSRRRRLAGDFESPLGEVSGSTPLLCPQANEAGLQRSLTTAGASEYRTSSQASVHYQDSAVRSQPLCHFLELHVIVWVARTCSTADIDRDKDPSLPIHSAGVV